MEPMKRNNRASHKLHVKGKHLVQAFPENTLSACQRIAILYTYLNLFEICKGLINVPSVVLETINSKLNVEARERAYLCNE